jgi:putative DNA primase/helicase
LRVYPENAPPLIINNQNVAGYLVIPCLSDEQIQTLHFIPAGKGGKLHLPAGNFNDGIFSVGKINDMSKPLYLCEGIGQAWAINEAINAPAIVCFGASRISRVAKVLRKKYPKAQLIIVPDRGQESSASQIAASVGGKWIELPQDMPPNYDVNDYAIEFGYEALAHLLEQLEAPTMRYKLLSGADLLNAPPMCWLIQGVLPAEGLAALYGACGSGKSFLTLDMGLSLAAGDNYWFGCKVRQTPVTYICLEGEAGMGKRLKAWSCYFKRPVPDTLKFIHSHLIYWVMTFRS